MEKASKAQLKRVKELLRDKKARDEADLFAAEGIKIVEDMVRKGHIPEEVIVSGDFAENDVNKVLLDELLERSIPVYIAKRSDLEKMSSLQNPQGIFAVLKKPDTFREIPSREGDSLLVLCDGIQDPGNVGAIIRTSAGFGADSLLLMGDSADVFNPKVIRASSGVMLDIPVTRCEEKDLVALKQAGYHFLASSVPGSASTSLCDLKDLPGKLVVAFGSEGKGLSDAVLDLADSFFHIPIDENVESLNVAAAAAIALYFLTAKK